MKDGKFEASDFWIYCDCNDSPVKTTKHDVDECAAEGIADRANALLPALREQWLAELRKDARTVWLKMAGPDENLAVNIYPVKHGTSTHQALLIDIKPIEK